MPMPKPIPVFSVEPSTVNEIIQFVPQRSRSKAPSVFLGRGAGGVYVIELIDKRGKTAGTEYSANLSGALRTMAEHLDPGQEYLVNG